MNASNINYHGMNLQVLAMTEGATGMLAASFTAIISIDGTTASSRRESPTS
jgi:hypothetical protein